MNRPASIRLLFSIILSILLVVVPACGMLEAGIETPSTAVADTQPTDLPPVQVATSEPTATEATTAEATKEPTEEPTATEATTDEPATTDTTTGATTGATQGGSVTWGEPICAPSRIFCIRPYAIQASGDMQILRTEVYGTGSAAQTRSHSVRWEATDAGGEDVSGNVCPGSYELFPTYREGSGHLSDICFPLAERPAELRVGIYEPGGNDPEWEIAVGDDREAQGDWSFFAGAQPLEEGATVKIGGATIVIKQIEDQGDVVVVEMDIASTSTILVSNPDLITIGPTLRFRTADQQGRYRDWHTATARGLDPMVGGKLDKGESQTGFVALEKAGDPWALVITFDSADAVILLPQGNTSAASGDGDSTTASATPTTTTTGAGAEPAPVATADTTATAAPERVNIELVFDASGSMAGDAGGGETKIEAARRAISQMLDQLPADVPALHVGFRVFGHEGDNTDAGKALSCQSTELLVPVDGIDLPALREEATAWEPTGWTPISLALQRAGEDLEAGPNVRNVIILVSDGEETCEGDPCAVAEALARSEAEVRIHVVGFGVEPEVARGLSCIATSSGGGYYDAPNGDTLAQLLLGLTLREVQLVAPDINPPAIPTPVFVPPTINTPVIVPPIIATPVIVPPTLP